MKRARILAVVVGAFILAHATGVLSGVESVLSRLAGARVALFDRPSNSISLESLVDQRAQAVCSQGLVENKALKGLSEYKDTSKVKPLVARFLGKTTEPERSMIVIDQGSEEGVRSGNPVIAENGILVGRVHRVESHRSFVTLLSDSRSKVLATFASRTRPRGIVQGQFQLGLKMELIPIEETIEKGTVIFTSGTQAGIPAGLVIGRVADIQSKPTDLFQSVRVSPPVAYDAIPFVSVLIQSDQ